MWTTKDYGDLIREVLNNMTWQDWYDHAINEYKKPPEWAKLFADKNFKKLEK